MTATPTPAVDWREQTCRTCGHTGKDHEANECWVKVDGKQCGCTWLELTAIPAVPSEPPLTDEAALSDAELASLEALRANAPGLPWRVARTATGGFSVRTEGGWEVVDVTYPSDRERLELIVAAVNALPRLVASLRSAREELMSARAERVELIAERDEAQAELAELTVEWGLRKPSGHVDGPYSHESYVQGENARRNSMGQPRRVVRRHVTEWRPTEEGADRGN